MNERPQWEDCKVCGGDHWTKDHPATGKIVVLPDEPPLRSALEWARLALIQDVEPDAIIVHIEQALAATSSAGCPCPVTFLNIEATCDECGHPLHGQPCPGAALPRRPDPATVEEIAAGIAEIGTGGTPAFIRGYNRGYDDAYEHAASRGGE